MKSIIDWIFVKKEFGYYEDSNDRLIGRIARFFLVQHTQTGKNIPNGEDICTECP
jgi:hypothetical protein